MDSSTTPRPRLRCRPIGEADLSAVADLLAKGFPARRKTYWDAGLSIMARRDNPVGCPRFGYVLESGGVPVGVLLTIYSTTRIDGQDALRCNFSSWYIEPPFQAFAALLVQQVLRGGRALFFIVSPAPHTTATNEALGFALYSSGRFIALAALARPFSFPRIERIGPGGTAPVGLPPEEATLIARHAALGCICLVVHAPQGLLPFIFLKTAIKGVPAAQLLYARSLDDFSGIAGPLGRALARRGRLAIVVDGDTPVPGLIGTQRRYGAVKLYKGASVPARCDLTDTEWVIFGP